MEFSNENAIAGGLFGFIILFLVCAFFTAILGMGVDVIVATHNGMIGTYPTSQDSINTGINLVIAFKAMMFVLLLAFGLNLLNNAQSEVSGEA